MAFDIHISRPQFKVLFYCYWRVSTFFIRMLFPRFNVCQDNLYVQYLSYDVVLSNSTECLCTPDKYEAKKIFKLNNLYQTMMSRRWKVLQVESLKEHITGHFYYFCSNFFISLFPITTDYFLNECEFLDILTPTHFNIPVEIAIMQRWSSTVSFAKQKHLL
jgi:hypothetical protein